MTTYDMVSRDVGINAIKNPKEREIARAQYRDQMAVYAGSATIGLVGGGGAGMYGIQTLAYFATNPSAAPLVGGAVWGLGTDQDAPGAGDDLTRLGRRAWSGSLELIDDVFRISDQHVDDVVKKVLKEGGKAKSTALVDIARESGLYLERGSTGVIGENALSLLGGSSQTSLKTTLGLRRVDQLVDGIAYEAKTGYTSLSASIKTQVAKDAELLQTGQVEKVIWRFYQSPTTGKAGASKPLQKALKNAGIETQVIKQ